LFTPANPYNDLYNNLTNNLYYNDFYNASYYETLYNILYNYLHNKDINPSLLALAAKRDHDLGNFLASLSTIVQGGTPPTSIPNFVSFVHEQGDKTPEFYNPNNPACCQVLPSIVLPPHSYCQL
jgi:hypothetical protein